MKKCIVLTPEVVARLQAEQKKTGAAISEIIRRAITFYLDSKD
jgi:predicted DNA-binding protein